MAIRKTEAIVLDRKDYRETSYLLSFFTPDFGKIHAQAKGARRKADKFGTSFLPLSHNTIVFYENPSSGLHIISQADLVENFGAIDKHVEKFTYAAYFLELVSAALPYGEKNQEVFNMVLQFLKLLDAQRGIDNIAQIFEIKFLNLSGFKPRLDCCVHCSDHIREKSRFSYVLGGLLCPRCFKADTQARQLMQGTIATINHIEHMELKHVNTIKIVRSVANELAQILRTFIDFHLGIRFKSLEFMKKVRVSDV